MQTGLGDNVDLNGGVAARVVHGTSVNLSDRHFEVCLKDGGKSVSCKKGKEDEKTGLRRG